MGIKRAADHIEHPSSRPRRTSSKRARLSPEQNDSSEGSTGSISEDSALRSSPPVSEHTRQSSISTQNATDEGQTSEDSDSSSDVDSESEDEIVTLGGPTKPAMRHTNIMQGAQDLRTRLNTLLPQLASANELLAHRAGVSMEDVGEGEEHIEMNLGLGVLEEIREDSEGSDSEDSDNDELLGEDYDDKTSSPVKQRCDDRKSDVMDDLLRRRPERRKAGIEDMGE